MIMIHITSKHIFCSETSPAKLVPLFHHLIEPNLFIFVLNIVIIKSCVVFYVFVNFLEGSSLLFVAVLRSHLACSMQPSSCENGESIEECQQRIYIGR